MENPIAISSQVLVQAARIYRTQSIVVWPLVLFSALGAYIFDNLKIVIYHREMPGCKVTWKNNALIPISPEFRMDLRKQGLGATWIESIWKASTAVAAGATSTIDLTWVRNVPEEGIPTDWGPGALIDVQIVIKGIEGAVAYGPAIFQVQALLGVEITKVEPYVVR